MILNNACEPREYSPELLAAANQPNWWPEFEKPLAAYLGTLDARFDFNAVEELCAKSQDTHFVLAGTILPEYEHRVERLIQLGNVTCPGRVSVEDGRYLLSHCAVGLIPFTPGTMNDAINPVKMYAYSLLGKPIVGTDVHELRIRPEIALVGKTGGELAERLRDAIIMSRHPESIERLRSFALENTWQHRADMAWSIIRPYAAQTASAATDSVPKPVSEVRTCRE